MHSASTSDIMKFYLTRVRLAKTNGLAYQKLHYFQTLLNIENNMGPYSPTILQNILSLVLQSCLDKAAFECNTTSDWLNHTV